MKATPVAAREPQQERSRLTRARLLEAAIECLAELGWSATTIAGIAERAGVSRGAAQHYFPTREELVTAALHYATEVRLAEIRGHAAKAPQGKRRTEIVLSSLTDFYTAPLFRAALQLWVAASADEKLRAFVVPLEARVGREVHRIMVELLGADEKVPGVRETVQATCDLARGLGLANLLTDDSARRRRLVRRWAVVLDDALALTPRPRPLAGEGAGG